jgi:hypothetical protein
MSQLNPVRSHLSTPGSRRPKAGGLARGGRVPHSTEAIAGQSGIEYGCPVMIHHYIREHQYRSPQEFIDSLLEMNPQS